MSEKPVIMVATPCFGGLLTQDYTMSLLNLQTLAQREGFEVGVTFLGNDALITRGRSALVARFLDVPRATHLLFIDSDITFDPEQVVRMLRFDRDFVAGLYPAKIIDWDLLAQRFGRSAETLPESGLAYVGAVDEGAGAARDGDFAKATYAGTGFQLIKRVVFERMIAAYPELKYSGVHAYPRVARPSENLYALFDCMIDPETGVYLSEDYAFCRRWRAIGGDIWLDLKSKLVHTGAYSFCGNAAARFG